MFDLYFSSQCVVHPVSVCSLCFTCAFKRSNQPARNVTSVTTAPMNSLKNTSTAFNMIRRGKFLKGPEGFRPFFAKMSIKNSSSSFYLPPASLPRLTAIRHHLVGGVTFLACFGKFFKKFAKTTFDFVPIYITLLIRGSLQQP